MSPTAKRWAVRDRVLDLGARPLVLGIVNVTPDSFSDGGNQPTTEAAVAYALKLVEQGADILDLGGESTRPGAEPVPLEEELRRVLPVVELLAQQSQVPLSVDTCKAEVAARCLDAGAHIINDVTALRGDAKMIEVLAERRAGVILMHMQGTPQTMQQNPHYDDVVAEVAAFFEERLQALANFGIGQDCAVLDPGIGFGKNDVHNFALLRRLDALRRLGRPVCLGVSRKGFLGRLLGRSLRERLAGSLAVVCFALGRGHADVLRVHDVAETRDAVCVFQTLEEEKC